MSQRPCRTFCDISADETDCCIVRRGRAVRLSGRRALNGDDLEIAQRFTTTLCQYCSTWEEVLQKRDKLISLIKHVPAALQREYFLFIDNSLRYISTVDCLQKEWKEVERYKEYGVQPWQWAVSEERVLTFYVAKNSAETLVDFLRFCPELLDLDKVLYLSMDFVLNNYGYGNAINMITLLADTKSVINPSLFALWKRYPSFCSLEYGRKMIDVLLELGISQHALRWLSNNIMNNCLDKDRVKRFNKVLNEPLSLKQISRNCIRRLIGDVKVVTASYQLSLPRSLQDYVSLEHLDAEIRKHLFATKNAVFIH